MLGKEVRTPSALVYGRYQLTGRTLSYVEKLKEGITKAHQIATDKNVKRQKDLYKVKIEETNYKLGDVVGS